LIGVLLLLQAPPGSGERWREALELDLAREVVAEALPQVSPDGALARDGQAIALAARALAATGREEQALELLGRADPTPASAGFVEVERARIALARDELARVRELLLVTPASGPPAPPVRRPAIPDAWLLAGQALARAGEEARAEPLLARFLELAPHDVSAPAAWHLLARAALARGDGRLAEERRARAADSARWQAYFRTRRLQVRASPGEPLPRLGLVELWLAVGEAARARAAAQELVELAPGFCRGHAALGRALALAGETDLARASFERALGCDARLLEAHLELARMLLHEGRRDEAERRHAAYAALGGKEPLEPR